MGRRGAFFLGRPPVRGRGTSKGPATRSSERVIPGPGGGGLVALDERGFDRVLVGLVGRSEGLGDAVKLAAG